MSDVSVVVSACRGVGTGTDELLDDDDWGQFKAALVDRVEKHCGTLVSYNEGTWVHEGGREPQVLLVAGALPLVPEQFKRDIGALALEFSQDSIAVLVGTPVFIGPDGQEV